MTEMTTRQIESDAELAILNGEPIVAFDILSTLEKDQYSPKCWQLLGQSLANCGSPHSARTILEKQYQNNPTPELCASLARVYKDLWKVSSSPKKSMKYITHSHRLYAESSEKYILQGNDHESYYTSINAASTAIFMDRRDIAVNFAEQARSFCEEILASQSPGSKVN